MANVSKKNPPIAAEDSETNSANENESKGNSRKAIESLPVQMSNQVKGDTKEMEVFNTMIHEKTPEFPTETRQIQQQRFEVDNFLNEVYSRLKPEDIFTDPSHDFKASGNKLRGGCPWHQSKTGTAFYVEIDKGMKWACPACEGAYGSPIHYLYKLEQGDPKAYPRGDDFIRLCKELGEMAGVVK